jgi:cellulose synthase operon protein C
MGPKREVVPIRPNAIEANDGGSSGGDSGMTWIVKFRFLGRSLVAAVVVAVGMYFWHAFLVHQQAGYYLDRAAVAENEKQWADAAGFIRDYLRLYPDDTEARIRLAKTFDRSATTPQQQYLATTYYYHALRLAPEQRDMRQRLAMLLVKLGGFSPAEEEAQQLLQHDPADPVGRRVLALCAYDRWRTTDKPTAGTPAVIDSLSRALEVNAGDIDLSGKLADIYRDELVAATESVRARLADAVMDRMVAADPNRAKARLARYEYRRKHHLVDKDQDLAKALELAPEDVDVLVAAGTQAEEQEHYTKARQYFQKSVSLAPKDGRSYVGLGNVYKAEGDIARAVAVWRKGLRVAGPENVELRTKAADALIELRRLDDATVAVQRLSRLAASLTPNGDRASRTGVRGLVAMLGAKLALASGDLMKGLDELYNAVAAQKVGMESDADLADQYQARMRLGQIYGMLAQWDVAATEYEQAAAIMPRDADARAALANAWQRAGRSDLAIHQYRQALELVPGNTAISLGLAECQLQQQLGLQEKKRDWEPLRNLLGQVKQQSPDAVRVQVLEALLEEAMGRPERSLQLLEKAASADPTSLRVVRTLMQAYQQRGNSAAADKVVADYEEAKGESAPILRAELLAQRQEYAKASQVLQRALPSLKGNQRIVAWQRLARLGLEAGQLNRVRQLLAQEAAQSANPDLRLVEELAECSLEAGDWKDLARWEKTLHTLEGERGSLWRYYRGRRLVAEAVDGSSPAVAEVAQLQDKLEGLRPSWASTYVLKARFAQQQGRMEDAADAYQRAVELGENHIVVLQQLVGLLYRQNRFVDADRLLQRLGRNVAGSQNLSAIALSVSVKRGEIDRTLRLALEGVQQHPDDPMAHVWLGMVLQLAGRTDEAEVTFYRAVKLAPQDPRTWTALAAFCMQRNRPTFAREAIENLAKNVRLAEGMQSFVLAQGYELIGDRRQAERRYSDAARQAPKDVAIQERVAAFFMATDPTQSDACLRRVLAVDPDAGAARYRLAMLLAARGGQNNLQEAWRLLGKASPDSAPSPVARRLQALLLLQRGDAGSQRQAQTILETLVRDADEPSADDRLILATLYESRGRLQAARQQLATLASRRHPKPSYLAAYVDYLLRHDSVADAAAWLARLEELDPDSFRTILLRSRLLKLEERSAEAEPIVETFTAKKLATLDDTEQVKLIENVADLYTEIGLPAAAERRYRQLAARTPEGYKPLAICLMRGGRRAEAIGLCTAAAQKGKVAEACVALCAVLVDAPPDQYDASQIDKLLAEAVAQHPHNDCLLFHVATLRYLQNRPEEAANLYRQLLVRNPGHVLAINNLASLLAEDPKERDEAQQQIDRAIDIEGPTAQLLDTRAVVWMYQGKLPQAIGILRELSDGAKVDPRYCLHLAMAYQRAGAVKDARTSLGRAEASGLGSVVLTPSERAALSELQKVLRSNTADKVSSASERSI